MTVRIGIVTTSDRAAAGVYADEGTPEVAQVLSEMLMTPLTFVTRLVPDDRRSIEAALLSLVDVEQCPLVVTTGGTGPAARDVTVDATLAVAHKTMPGFGELMRKVSLEQVPTAILSRQEAVIRHSSLIVNLPGSIRSIRTCLMAVMPAIPYCIDLLGGPFLETNASVVVAFRPKKS
jgi:molybdopterin adenylyltransferase